MLPPGEAEALERHVVAGYLPLLEEALPGLAYLYGEDHHHTRGIQYR